MGFLVSAATLQINCQNISYQSSQSHIIVSIKHDISIAQHFFHGSCCLELSQMMNEERKTLNKQSNNKHVGHTLNKSGFANILTTIKLRYNTQKLQCYICCGFFKVCTCTTLLRRSTLYFRRVVLHVVFLILTMVLVKHKQSFS